MLGPLSRVLILHGQDTQISIFSISFPIVFSYPFPIVDSDLASFQHLLRYFLRR